jgi:hypothetical protein
MNCSQLEHTIRASGSIADEIEFARAAIRQGSANRDDLLGRIQELRIDDPSTEKIRQRWKPIFITLLTFLGVDPL